jgi:putative phosphoserine phosphatase/1-acylglycerol-3-phosphate O-acyltransferase
VKPYAELTGEVEAGRGGPSSAAFFDFDGTLLAGFSVFHFLARRYLKGRVSAGEAIDQALSIAGYALKQTDFTGLLDQFTLAMAGQSDEEMWRLAQEVFDKDLAGRIYPETRALLKAHQEKGHTVVLLSSATQYQLAFVAEELGVEHVLCTRLEVEDGLLTGYMEGAACYGEEKCRIALEFARRHRVNLKTSWFYSDGAEDLPLLEAVGRPRPLNPDKRLTIVAQDRDWPIRRFESRGSTRLADVIRTGLVYGSFIPSFLVGAPAWLLNRSRRDVINLGLSIWSDFGSAVAGLDVRVSGEEHLWSQRPAVFIFNHQSATDVLILARLLRQDYTGMTKQEMKKNPLLGPALQFADAVFIDRQGKADPAEVARPALEKLARGLSIAIAPEGHRSAGYRLGPFKKGAFHIAMQAGVPIVPIVIANSSDSLPRSAVFIRPACIEVKVLAPVSTGNWDASTIEQHVRDCRELFLRELGQPVDGKEQRDNHP